MQVPVNDVKTISISYDFLLTHFEEWVSLHETVTYGVELKSLCFISSLILNDDS